MTAEFSADERVLILDRFPIAIVGPSRCGKDLCADLLSELLGVRRCPPCSSAILPFAAVELGLDLDVAWPTRHQHADVWDRVARRLRERDSVATARHALRDGGQILVGLRCRDEFLECRHQRLFRFSVWVDRPGTPLDSKLTFGPEECDAVFRNETQDPLEVMSATRRNLIAFLRSWLAESSGFPTSSSARPVDIPNEGFGEPLTLIRNRF